MENNTNFQTFHQMGQAINDFVKQATGRDNVQNIDMDHITVAQNRFYQDVDVSGRVVSFHAGAAGLPLEKCVVQIEPVQDLHGYDHPWPAGGGLQLIPYPYSRDLPVTLNGITFTDIGEGRIHAQGTATNRTYLNLFGDAATPIPSWIKPDTQYTLRPIEISSKYFAQFILYGNPSYVRYGSTFITPSDLSAYTGFAVVVGVSNGAVLDDDIFPMLEYGATAHDFSPYSNICPITGWTDVKVYRAGENLEDANVFEIALPAEAGTVYGGTLDVVSGELVVDRASVDLGTLTWTLTSAGSFGTSITGMRTAGDLPDNAICDYYPIVSNGFNGAHATEDKVLWQYTGTDGIRVRDSAFATNEQIRSGLTGHYLCYTLSTPLTYQLTPTEITTLLGVNNIWSDAGDIEVKFKDLKELY